MVECNGCGITLHLRCLSPPRQTALSRSFFCPACNPKGLSATHELYMPRTPSLHRQNDPYLCIDLHDFLADGTLPYKATPPELAMLKLRASSYPSSHASYTRPMDTGFYAEILLPLSDLLGQVATSSSTAVPHTLLPRSNGASFLIEFTPTSTQITATTPTRQPDFALGHVLSTTAVVLYTVRTVRSCLPILSLTVLWL